MTTPTAEAIRGLVELARKVAADNDGDCNGWATPARAALAAFEKRQPLREDAGVLLALAHFVSDNLTAGEAADLIDAALFGPPTKEGSRGA